jgi:outer membrane protein assembly factor BamE (lipoprotein component of BamABCDE complex)
MRSIRNLWKNHRGLTAVGILMVLTISVCGVVWLGNFPEQRRFAAIEIGMTEDAVLAILGPPGQYGPPGAKYCRSMCYL